MSETKIIETESREMSFLELAKNYVIVIPSIQRDYAQGRKNVKARDIRKKFTEELKSYIESGQKHSLDFIYGSTEPMLDNIDNRERFIPLDGQQRLTTLFLLHLYLEGVGNHASGIDYKFSYETRDSSRRFCDNLISHRDSIFTKENFSEKEDDKTQKIRLQPSDIIKNEDWWFGSWEDDPTVNGMLVMLDRINEIFYEDAEHLASNLFNPKSPPICFQFLPMKRFHDTDDLYMKMNARGLSLTSFELFKSRLKEDVDSAYADDITKAKDFHANLDNRWIDVLWHIALEHKLKNADVYLERLLKVIISSEFAAKSIQDGKRASDTSLETLFETNKKTMPFDYGKYLELGVVFDRDLIERISGDVDLLCSVHTSPMSVGKPLSEFCNLIGLQNDNQNWVYGSEQKLTYQTRLMLHGVLKFYKALNRYTVRPENCDLQANSNGYGVSFKYDLSQLREWIHVLLNLANARDINSAAEMANALANIEQMFESYIASEEQTVNDWVASNRALRHTFFYDFQWEEEVTKAQLSKNCEWRRLIIDAEQQPYLNGQIAIILHLSNLIPIRTPFKDIGTEIPSTKEFAEVSQKLLALFDSIQSSEGNDKYGIIQSHLLVRAMLKMGDYLKDGNIMNNITDRDYSWKRLFRIDNSTQSRGVVALGKLMKYLNPDDIRGSLQEVVNTVGMGNRKLWERVLVGKYGHQLLSEAGNGFIRFDFGSQDPNCPDLRILTKKWLSSWHCELYTRYLYYYLKDSDIFPNSIDVRYERVYGDDNCRVKIGNKTIMHWNGWLPEHHYSWLVKEIDEEGKEKETGYLTITEVLDALGISHEFCEKEEAVLKRPMTP